MRRVHSCYEESEATAMARRNASFLTAPKWVRFETAKYLLLLEANRPKWVRLVFLLFLRGLRPLPRCGCRKKNLKYRIAL